MPFPMQPPQATFPQPVLSSPFPTQPQLNTLSTQLSQNFTHAFNSVQQSLFSRLDQIKSMFSFSIVLVSYFSILIYYYLFDIMY